MSDAVLRVELPSGGWWEVDTRPRWGLVRGWAFGWQRDQNTGMVDSALVSLTTGWSFREAVSPETLEHRDQEDLIAMLEAFLREVVPFVRAENPTQMAEALLAGLVKGEVPTRFAEVHVMAATGWTWQALQDTPADVVQAMAVYLAVQQARRGGGTLRYHDTEAQQDDR